MTLNGAIKQLHELRAAEDMPIYYKPALAEVINVLLMDAQEVRHGQWIDGKRMSFDGTLHWFRQCSECLYEREDDTPEKDTNYCPNCGVKMVNGDG